MTRLLSVVSKPSVFQVGTLTLKAGTEVRDT